MKLDFCYFDAGGGHRSAATALELACRMQNRPWQIRLVNLQDELDSLDIFRKLTGIRLQDIYNKILKRGWTLGSAQLLPAMQLVLRIYHGAGTRALAEFWRRDTPDMVVSLVPNLNRTAFAGLQAAAPGTPYVNILTDLADYPPHFWMEQQPQYFICGTEHAAQQALAMGHARERVFTTPGMILHPRFYEPVAKDRAAERARLGLRADVPTGLVLFGGQGSRVMLEIAERLDASALDVQLILICGHNAKLAERLRARAWRIPHFVEGFTKEIPYYMHLCDFFIGKPGPGSISEALAMQLPVLLEENSAWTLPQERFNTQWVREKQLGVIVPSFRDIAAGVEQLLAPETYQRLRANIAAIQNRAVFEIPAILEGILAAQQRA